MTWRKSTASCDDGASCVWVDVKAGMVLVRGDDGPPEPFDQGDDGFKLWELVAVLAVIVLAIVGAAAMAAAIIATGTHVYRWLT